MKKLIVMCLLAIMASAANAGLMTNAGFESMSGSGSAMVPDNWTLYPGNGATVYFAAKTDVVYEGIYSEKIAARNGYGMIHQTITSGFAAGDSLSFWLYARGDTNNGWKMDEAGDAVDVSIKFKNAGGTQIGSELSMILFDSNTETQTGVLSSTEWLQSPVFTFVVPEETAFLQVKIRAIDGVVDGGNTNGTSVYLDNITLVPEPATLVLLGLGGLLGLRRK